MKIDEVVKVMEMMGLDVVVNRSQSRGGTLGRAWVSGKIESEITFPLVLDEMRRLTRDAGELMDGLSITVDHIYKTKKTQLKLCWFPVKHEEEKEARNRWGDDVKIIPCYVPCPVVSDTGDE